MKRAAVASVIVAGVAALGTGAAVVEAGTSTAPAAPTKKEIARWRPFFQARCAACHTLADAKTHGRIGPDLNKLKPPYAKTVTQITRGGGTGLGVMPKFGDVLKPAEIRSLSRYVYWASRRR